MSFIILFLCFSTTCVAQFGDSMNDNGNDINISPFGPCLPSNHYPYGITNNKSTGTWSDGYAMADHFAMIYDGRLISPYLGQNWRNNTSEYSLNFAVAGSTSLNTSTLSNYSIETSAIPDLATQIDWFTLYMTTHCNDNCSKYISYPYVVIGPIGGMDIVYAITQGRNETIATLIPLIVDSIIASLQQLLTTGVNYIHINSNLPLGCLPFALKYFNDNITEKDSHGCIESVNQHITDLNNQLSSQITSLSSNQLDYGDLYSAFLAAMQSSGFKNNIKPCCGNGAFDLSDQFCGGKDAFLCNRPEDYIHWDGIHLTQAAYAFIVDRVYDNLNH